jgi:uncharacterized protein
MPDGLDLLPKNVHFAETGRFYQSNRFGLARKPLQCCIFQSKWLKLGKLRRCNVHTPRPNHVSNMKLHQTATQAYQTVTGYQSDSIDINGQRFGYSILLMPERVPQAWPISDFAQLHSEHLAAIMAHEPELIILGTGNAQHFIHPRLLQGLHARRIGIESMDNQAACRTYNILMAEGRKVALAVILPGAA